MALIVRGRAPLRLGFGGGGTDVTPYPEQRGGAVLSTTINRYAYATVATTATGRLRVTSIDYDRTVEYGLADQFLHDSQLSLAQGIIDHFRRNYALETACGGLDISLHNDAPPGSGLGSSSAIAVALVGALLSLLKSPLEPYALAELSYLIERDEVGIKGGRQDQYAAAFGGLNFIEFRHDATIVHPIRLWSDLWNELQYSMVFAYIGGQRFSGDIIEQQIRNVETKAGDSLAALDEQKALAFAMKDALLTRRLGDFGQLLNEAWRVKKRFASGITNSRIDGIYEAAMRSGAIGGKISGAGGGGFMMFFCDPADRFRLQNGLKTAGCDPVDIGFTLDGLTVWSMER